MENKPDENWIQKYLGLEKPELPEFSGFELDDSVTDESVVGSPGKSKVIYQTQLSGSEGAYQGYCAELIITAFGDTPEAARNSLRLQVADYLEDCDNLGALDEVLIDAGFYFDGEAWISNDVTPVKDPDIVIF